VLRRHCALSDVEGTMTRSFAIVLSTCLTLALLTAASTSEAMSAFRHPVLAVSHGPGPMWLLKKGIYNRESDSADNVASIFQRVYSSGSSLPKRILFISAHWQSKDRSAFEISTASSPEMIYDYYGFPRESYSIQYPAKGDPAFAVEVSEQLAKHQFKAKLVERGFDHGVFVPMMLIRPEADIPIVTLSINDKFDAKTHFEVGKAIASFRDQDTLIICSGQATHNLYAGFEPYEAVEPWASEFQKWIDDTFTARSSLSYADRRAEIENWRKVPTARQAHPSPDHFTPFIVAAGAGMEEAIPVAKKLFGGWGGQLSFASYAFGVDVNESNDARDEL
jgi:4,5-DOPA dioxygenase extradiol